MAVGVDPVATKVEEVRAPTGKCESFARVKCDIRIEGCGRSNNRELDRDVESARHREAGQRWLRVADNSGDSEAVTGLNLGRY